MKKQYLLLGVLLISPLLIFAQEIFRGEMQELQIPELEEHFYEVDIFRFEAGSLAEAARATDLLSFQLAIGDAQEWEINIVPNDMRAPNYKLRAMTEDGIKVYPSSPLRTFKGYHEETENSVRLTLDKNLIYGYIEEGDTRWFIEPLHNLVSGQANDLFVLYRERDVIPHEGEFCAADELQRHTPRPKNLPEESRALNDCWEVELAIASDYQMFVKYNMSIALVEAHTEGVMNNVQGNYDDEFADQIFFNIVEQFVSICNTCDPWTSSNNASALLGSFRNWGPNGFSETHDLGQLWTNRNLSGSTIGIAYVAAVCTNSRYHVLQDFSNNAGLLRVLTAHEIGHNFSCSHDSPGSPTIMAPAVNNTNNWSSMSVSQVNNFLNFITPPGGCLAPCPSLEPPSADFKAILTELCPGTEVQFINLITGDFDNVLWEFPGGSPSSSTALNPSITYNNPGVYTVSLTIFTSQGIFLETKPGYISVGPNGKEILLFDNFEAGLGFWSISNPDNSNTWGASSVGGAPLGSNAAVMTNYNYTGGVGQLDGLISPPIDLTGRATASISFEHAYARRPPNLDDPLRIKVSTDGGATFPNTVFIISETGGGNYATTEPKSDPFIPSERDDWCYGGGFGGVCLTIDLSQFAGEPNVVIMFENECGFGNNLYIDNVVIAGGCFIDPPIANFTAQPTTGCAPLTVSYIDLSINNPTSWEWDFPGGDPPSSNLQNPTVVYTERGVYDATLKVSNVGGSNSMTIPSLVNVEDAPIAEFSYTISGDTVFFNNETQFGQIYAWSFGNGEVSSSENPTYIYPEPGTYDVQLTASNLCGVDVFELTLTIESAPKAGFTADTLKGCAPLSVEFTDTSKGMVDERMWLFPGGSPDTSSAESPTVTYDTAGYYDVTLIVSNSLGADTLTMDSFIQIQALPVADFTDSIELDTVFFTNTSSWADSVYWEFGDDSTSTDFNPVHVYAEDGEYTVTLIVANDCGSDTLTGNITIATPPTAAFGIDTTMGCPPLLVTFSDSSSHNTDSLQWFFPGGIPTSSTDTMPVVEYESGGVYAVTLIAINAQGADTLTLDSLIFVDGLPTAAFDSEVDSLTVALTNISTNADEYLWDFGNGIGSSEENPTYVYDLAGVYTLTLIATNECGSDTTSQEISVGTLPVAAFTLSPEEGCAPLQVQFFDASSPNTTSWEWSFPGGNPSTSTEQNPVVTYQNSGVFDVTLVATNGLGSNSFNLPNAVSVQDVPQADLSFTSFNLDFVFTDESVDADSVFWDFGDGNNSKEENPSHSYAGPGAYTVTLIAFNDCGTDTTSQEVEATSLPVAAFTADDTLGCVPLSVQFTSNASGNTQSILWSFPGGVPTTSADPEPVVTYNQTGAYDVTLIATNPQGSDTLTLSNYITVIDQPSAGFSSQVNGLEVSFTNNSSNGDSYLWDFGDMNNSNVENPVHTYEADGIYEVQLVVENECGTDTAIQILTVGSAPQAGFTADPTAGCIPLEVHFQSTASTNTVSIAWEFPGGVPATSNDPDPVVTYEQAGVYTVSQIVTNALGSDTLTQNDYITVDAPPLAGFSGAQSGLSFSFTNTSQNADTYTWNFGDLQSSNEENPSHQYGQPGTYNVQLIASNFCGNDTFSLVVEVLAPPVASFKADNSNGCSPLLVTFQNQSSGEGNTYLWEFEGGDPATSTEENPMVTYNDPGSFPVSLTVTNIAGNSSVTETDYVTVLPNPTVGFSFDAQLNTVSFSNNSSHADEYFWDFGDMNNSNMENPVHIYDEDGQYTVTLTVWNECDTVSTSQTVNVITPPTAGFDFDPEEGCAPLEVTFTDASSENTASWEWWFFGPDTSSTTEPSPVVNFQQVGIYSIMLIASNAAGTDTIIVADAIEVDDVPASGFTFSSSDLSVDFTNNTTNGMTYLWLFGDDNSSMEENPSHTYDQPGFYNVMLIASNFCGSDTSILEVKVPSDGAAPAAAFSADTQEGCIPFTVNFTDESTNAPTSWAWTFPGGEPSSSTESNPTVTYNSAGEYEVELIATNAFGDDTLRINSYITVGEAPLADFDYTAMFDTLMFAQAATAADSYFWNFGDGNTSTEENPTHVYGASGDFTVTLIVENACGADTLEQLLNVIITNTQNLPGQQYLRIFPNPNNGFFTLDLQAASAPELQIDLFDVLGRRLLNREVDFRAGRATENFTVDQLAAGSYILQLRLRDKVIQRKIVITR